MWTGKQVKFRHVFQTLSFTPYCREYIQTIRLLQLLERGATNVLHLIVFYTYILWYKNEHIKEIMGVKGMLDVTEKKRLQWYDHVKRRQRREYQN
jgi:hypothetical protein